MPTSTASSADGTLPTRIIIIDDHEISRAACRALLRAEGIDVTADLRASDQALTAARTLRPDVAIVDVTPAAEAGFGIADGLRALPAPPTVILTSSAERTQFGARLNGLRFIAKADICAAAIARLARAPDAGGPESPDAATAANRPQPRE
jgi:DNA-binding NarL/FixJ family response regulator